MNLLKCPVCQSNLHVKEYKVKENTTPEGFLFCSGSKPIHFIGTLDHIDYDPDRAMEFTGYVFLGDYIIHKWGKIETAMSLGKKHQCIVYEKPKKYDAIKCWKMSHRGEMLFKHKFYIDETFDYQDLTEELIKNYEIME